MDHLGILGCGWLGEYLANRLYSEKWSVKVSRTSAKGKGELKAKGWDSYRIKLNSLSIEGDLNFFENLDTLLISVPPKRDAPSQFEDMIATLLEHMKLHPGCKLIFLSSTSVYGKQAGIFKENSPISAETEASKALVLCEKMILNAPQRSLIIRLGGLVGEDRNPIFSLQKKTIPNPRGRINFVSQVDVVNGIEEFLKYPQMEGIFNLVSPHHPVREEYYREMAKKYNLPEPQFDYNDSPSERFVEASKIEELTAFRYTVNNLLI
ncbi:hypothetical protein N9J23_01925 [Flavobacteriaceae bacterium]|jgi:hypothetical protein|nr:hypothetical protein [Flavobacteriaceae bacterium]MDA9879252.1 hypothetical protein [Flavobacteriaceae bacterium]